MTTGQRLVAISTLASGTAMEHFMNIEAGGVVINIHEFSSGIVSVNKPLFGKLQSKNDVIGKITSINSIKGKVQLQSPLKGIIETKTIKGKIQ